MGATKNYKYDFAISFAGEQRELARQLSDLLEKNGAHVFFDEREDITAELWGSDLSTKFGEAYYKNSRFFIPFISKEYGEKIWPNFEFQHGISRFIEQKGEYVLPIRVDDTKLPSLPNTIGYLDLRTHSIEQIANIAIKKLEKTPQTTAESSPSNTSSGLSRSSSFAGRMPKIKREVTEKDKDQFMKETFAYLAEQIKSGLTELDKSNAAIETDFEKVDTRTVTGAIYVDGQKKQAFKIWRGGEMGRDAICYREGHNISFGDRAMNEIVHPEIVDGELYVKPLMMGVTGMQSKFEKQEMNKETLAEYLWERIIRPLE